MNRDLRIIDDVCPEALPGLRSIILELEGRAPSVGSNNVGGWKSATNFLDLPHVSVALLRGVLEASFLPHIGALGHSLVGWAMVNRPGSYHKRHTHGLRYQCGVYYVTAGDSPTPTIFETPVESQRDHETAVAPNPGRLALFPGSMPHHVPIYGAIYGGNEPRISIAFEVRP